MLPNFLVVGAAKSGTTTLYEFFRRHKEIFVPSKKELNFFSLEYDKGLKYYESYFKKADNYKAIGDVSPSYLWVRNTSQRIYTIIPEVKIIILLRNPIERFYSDYRYSQIFGYNLNGIPNDFYKNNPNKIYNNNSTSWYGLKVMLKKGLYSKLIREYLEIFKLENIHIVLSESLFKNYHDEVYGIQKFLGVNFNKIDKIKKNEGGMPKSFLLIKILNYKHKYKNKIAKIIGYERAGRLKEKLLKKNIKQVKIKFDPILKEYLINFYKNDIIELQNIINIDLSDWLKN